MSWACSVYRCTAGGRGWPDPILEALTCQHMTCLVASVPTNYVCCLPVPMPVCFGQCHLRLAGVWRGGMAMGASVSISRELGWREQLGLRQREPAGGAADGCGPAALRPGVQNFVRATAVAAADGECPVLSWQVRRRQHAAVARSTQGSELHSCLKNTTNQLPDNDVRKGQHPLRMWTLDTAAFPCPCALMTLMGRTCTPTQCLHLPLFSSRRECIHDFALVTGP